MRHPKSSRSSRFTTLGAAVAVAVLLPSLALAEPQFSTGLRGPFAPTNSTVTFDTDDGTWSGATSGSGGRVVVQPGSIEVMVFDFTTIDVPMGVTILAKGHRALALAATGPVVIGGVVDVSGTNGGGPIGQRGGPGGPGGGGGGAGGDDGNNGGPVTGGTGGLGGGGGGCLGGFLNTPSFCTAATGGGLANGSSPSVAGNGGAGGGGAVETSLGKPYGGGGGGGGPGGGSGGAYGNGNGCLNGVGIGAGGGGGFATPGGNGQRVANSGTIPGGAAYGADDLEPLQGGSGGGGGAEDRGTKPGSNGGGGGGGALMITSTASITITPTGQVVANGGSALGDPNRGDKVQWAGGGGGAGGALYLDAPVVSNLGAVCARGGVGGVGDISAFVAVCDSSYRVTGGNGGGGRIVLYGAASTGTVCSGTGSIKLGPFRCSQDADCASGVCDPGTKQCKPGPADAGSDSGGPDGSPSDASVGDGGSDASPSGEPSSVDRLSGGGCSCSLTTSAPSKPAVAGASVALLVLLLRRRRRLA